MVFGVDECRVCGKPIKPTSGDAMIEYQASLRGKPTMSEYQWRKAGYKIMPTIAQMKRPRMGCCLECGMTQLNRAAMPLFGYILIGVCFVVFFTAWITITFYMTR